MPSPTQAPSSPSLPPQAVSRIASEVRDGIANQRDLEHGATDDDDDDGWDGPDDADNPRNWAPRRKWAAVLVVSLFTLISPVASSMVAPGLEAIGRDLAIATALERALVLSIFVAAYALGPLAWGPLSELRGRAPVLLAANALFLAFNLGCGFARTAAQMMACRFLAGLGGSAPLAVGGGVLADLFAAEQRGRAIGVYSLMPLLGPAVGPIAGGWIAERTTWRWVFWSTSAVAAAVEAAGLLLRETYAPAVLAARRRRRARAAPPGSGSGSGPAFDNGPDPGPGPARPRRPALGRVLGRALARPLRLLLTQPIVQVMALYMMYLYGLVYLVLSTFPRLWAGAYGQSPGVGGLNYLSLGLGFFLGTQLCAPLQDRVYAALKRRYGIAPGAPGRPEFRVPIMVPGAVLVPAGLLVYSWTAEFRTHWIWPNVGACLLAAGTIIGFQCVQAYMVDSYARFAASAVGAVTVLRSLAGFGFPLFAPAMYDALGLGWGGTVLAGCAIVIGWPAPVLLWLYGPRLRERSKFAA